MTTALQANGTRPGSAGGGWDDDAARRLERLRHVTANYRCMQGLRMVPFGLYLVLWSLTKTVWWPASPALQEPIPDVVGITLALIAASWIGRYYARTYGEVQSLPRTVPWIVGYAASCSLVLVGIVADAYLSLPVSGFALAFAALMVLYWRVTGSFQTHYLWGAAALAALAFAALPLHELTRPYVESRLSGMTVYMAITGLLYALAGYLDHRNLVAILGRGRLED
jgi:heme/copper-type cytochrome/quinol oxidase subunit 3